ncbi:MAG: PAS domain S-box protein [Planctomycetota bacterium]|nr:PAS domain S-box protein [Planctomycetota bacterium]
MSREHREANSPNLFDMSTGDGIQLSELTINDLPAPVLVLESDKSISDCNSAAEEFLGCTASHLRGVSLFEFVSEKDREELKEQIEDSSSKGRGSGVYATFEIGGQQRNTVVHTRRVSHGGREMHLVFLSACPVQDGEFVREATRSRPREVIDVSRRVISTSKVTEAMRSVLDECIELMEVDGGFLAFYDDRTDSMQVKAVKLGEYEDASAMPDLGAGGLRDRMKQVRGPVIENDFPRSTLKEALPTPHPDIEQVLAAPMLADERITGFILLCNKVGGFTGEDSKLAHAFAQLAQLTRSRLEELIELERSESKYRRIFDNSRAGIYRTRFSDGKVLMCNRRCAEMFGYESEEAAKKNLSNGVRYVRPEIREEFTKQLERYGHCHQMVAEFDRGDGGTTWLSYSGRYVREDGYIEGVAIDITELINAEQALKWELRVNETLAELASQFMSNDVETEDLSRMVLDRAKELVGGFGAVLFERTSPKEGFDSKYISETRPYRNVCERFSEDCWRGVLEKVGEGYTNDLRVICEETSGAGSLELKRAVCACVNVSDLCRTRIVLVNSPSPYSDGSLSGLRRLAELYAIALVRKETEERNVELEKQLEHTRKIEAVGQLSGGIAHDFNNLLSPIIGYTDMMLATRSSVDPDYSKLQRILESSNRAKELTQQLLAFSRKKLLKVSVLDLNKVLRGFYEMLRRLIREDISIYYDLADDLGRIKADETQLHQMVMNLALNARDAMPDGGDLTIKTANVTLDGAAAQACPGVSPGEYVVLSVEDTGTGMSKEVLNKAFEPFFTTKEVGKGTGLGLATVYGLVKELDGAVVPYSEVGEGTTFKIFFPRTQEFAEDSEEGEEDLLRSLGTEKVMVVEDEPTVRELVSEVLRDCGYEVLEFASPVTALKTYRELSGGIDLLITDIVMPHMKGTELYRELRAMQEGLKVLFISGYTDNVLKREDLEADKGGFLSKPFSIQSLVSKVREVLEV